MLTPFDATRKLALPVILTLDEAEAPRVLHDPLPLPAYMSAQDAQVLSEMLRRRTRRSSFSLQVVGADAGVGTTSLVADMALHAARNDRHVLILDMEPQALSPLDVLARRGARLEKMDAHGRAFRCAGSDLWVIRPPPQGESLSQREWMGLIEETCGDFDVVLVDAPPLTRSWQSVLAAPAVDVTLMVVEAEKTRAPAALNTLDRIAAAGGEVAGIILNRRRFHIPRAIYARL
jgi:Mrp family chromosome partitioning ATPase